MKKHTLKKSMMSLALCVTMTASAVPIFADEIFVEQQPTEYISDIKIATSKNSDTAAKTELEEAGYTVLPYNLNKGTGEDRVYLGYQSTTNADEAITDIRAMNMYGGYQFVSKDEVLDKYRTTSNKTTEALKTAALGFREKYNAGSPKAANAKIILDKFIYTSRTEVDSNGMPFGEYILRHELSTEEWNDLIFLTNSEVLSAVLAELLIGTIDYDATFVPESAYDAFNNADTAILNADEETVFEVNAVMVNRIMEESDADASGQNQTGDSVTDDSQTQEIAGTESTENYAVEDENRQETATDDANDLSENAEVNTENLDEDASLDDESADEESADEESEVVADGDIISDEPDDAGNSDATDSIADDSDAGTDSGSGDRILVQPEQVPYTWLYRFSQYRTPSNAADQKSEISLAANLLSAVSREGEKVRDALAAGYENCDPEQKILWMAYHQMNRFTYKEQGIGDYLYLDENLTVEKLAPLAASMSTSQRSMVGIFGVSYYAMNLVNTTEELRKETEELKKLAADTSDVISIWDGYSDEMYSEQLAVTDAYIRQAAAGNYSSMQESYKSRWKVRFENIQKYVTYASLALTLVSAGLGFVLGYFSVTFTLTFAGGLLFSIAGFAMAASNVLVVIDLIILAVILVIEAIDWYNYYHPDYTTIPGIIYDWTTAGYASNMATLLRYEVVTKTNGDAADVNAFEGKEWLCLYTSKDADAGAPITTDMLVRYGDGSVPSGYSPLRMFGMSSAVNLNTATYKDSVNGIYLFFERDGYEEYNDEKKYVSSLKVVSGTDEVAVLNEIAEMEKYFYIPVNLTQGTNYYTYVAYQTADDAANAVTDIRVGLADAIGGSISIGSSSYADAGLIPDNDLNNIHLLYTNSTTAGTPILSGNSNFTVTHDLKAEVPLGSEPVNLLTGGPAFNLQNAKGKTYLYFMPETTYPAVEGATEYLGGITLVTIPYTVNMPDTVSGRDQFMQAFADYYGCRIYSDDLLNIGDFSYIGYTTTYNPYRAIRGIVSYSASDNDSKMATSMSLALTGDELANAPINQTKKASKYTALSENYAVVPTFYMLDEKPQKNYFRFFEIGSNAYTSSSTFSKRANALYVVSGTDDLPPIEIDDWCMTTKEETASMISQGYRPVSDILDSTGSAANLRNGSGSKTGMYMYYKGNLSASRGTYISGIVLGGSYQSDKSIDADKTLTSDQKKALKKIAKKETYAEAVQNVFTNGGMTYVGKISQSSKHCQYNNLALGVTWSDKTKDAIRDIKLVYISGQTPPTEIMKSIGYNTNKNKPDYVTYTLASSIPVYVNSFDTVQVTKKGGGTVNRSAMSGYYLYTSKSQFTGKYITDVSMIGKAYLDGTEMVEAFNWENEQSLQNQMISQKNALAELTETYRQAATKDAYKKTSGYITISRQTTNAKTGEVNENQHRYITNLSAYNGYFKPSDSDKNDMAYETTYLTKVDMNKGAGGRYIYLGYQRSYLSDDAITDVLAVYGKKSAYKDVIYRWVPEHKSPSGETIKGKYVAYLPACHGLDLNKGTGGSKNYIFLYYTRDPDVASPIIDLQVVTGKYSYEKEINGKNYDTVLREGHDEMDFNKGVGGDYIYLKVLHEKGDTPNQSIFVGSVFTESTAGGVILFAVLLSAAWITTGGVRRYRKRKQEGGK